MFVGSSGERYQVDIAPERSSESSSMQLIDNGTSVELRTRFTNVVG